MKRWADIVRAMCQAEPVHEANAAAGFVPSILFSMVWACHAFMIAPLQAAGYDLLFAILQRYNRPRILYLAARKKQRSVHLERTFANEKV